MSVPTVLDLFSGACGGWSLGLHRAGFRTVAACEIDPWRRAVFSRNFPDARLYDDVQSLEADRLVRDGVSLPDVVVGSPPCQDASSANTSGKGLDGDRTGLFFEAIRIVGECRPRYAAFENVPGIRTRGVDRVFDALEGIGYACWPFVVGADDIGAPHERKRAWFLAVDASQIGRRERWSWRSDRGAARPADAPWREASAGSDPGGAGWQKRDSAEPSEQEISPALRRIATDWPSWNGGLGGSLRVGDGVPPGVARRCISAYGDAVLPQITEAIGRAILSVEASISIGRAAA